VSRKNGKSSGKIDINEPLTTGWADWQLPVDKTMAHAEQWMDFTPAKSESDSMTAKDLPDGVKVRVEQNGENIEQWVPAGWQISVPVLLHPSWLLKWIVSLLVVVGVFIMYNLQPYRKQTEGKPITPYGPVGSVRNSGRALTKFSPAMKLSIIVLVSALFVGCA